MDELINAMSNEELLALREKHKDNDGIVRLIDGILEGRAKAEAQAKVRATFEKELAKLLTKLPHPDNIHNVYICWSEVDVIAGDGEEVVLTDDEGNTMTETRYPTRKEHQWVVKVNHAIKVALGNGDGVKASKRAITVYKRSGTQLEEKGNYSSASKACDALGLPIGGDSATRVLARESYIVESYEGTDYTA